MKIAFPIEAFAAAAKAVRNVPGASANIDILSHAMMRLEGGTCTLIMSDLDIEARASFASDKSEVAAALPRAVLDFFVAREGAGEAEATMEFDDDMRNVVARHGRARLSMPILRAEDFHLLNIEKADWTITLRAHEFCSVLARCEKAVETNADRYMLHGPFLHVSADTLKAIALDGRRIHLIEFDQPQVTGKLPTRASEIPPGIIIPPRAVKEIQRIFAGDESEMRICGTAALMMVETARLRVTSKLIDATYYDYSRILPAKPDQCVNVAADKILRALDGLLVEPKTDAKGKRQTGRVIRITVQEKAIVIFTTGDTGEAEDTVEAEVSGVPTETYIQFNAQYLRDVIDAAGSKMIAFHPPAEIGLPFHISGAEGSIFVIGQQSKM